MARCAQAVRRIAGGLCVLAVVAAAAGLLTSAKTAYGAPGKTPPSHPFGGFGPVGALFTTGAGRLGHHFCTATVVHSAHGDLAVTAAHCLNPKQGTLAFVPKYADGKAPWGSWAVTAVFTDRAWQSSRNPDDDVAFLRLSGDHGRPVERVAGAEQLGLSHPPELAWGIVYPVKSGQPYRCENWVRSFTPAQLKFVCGGFTNGSSGGPFLAGAAAASGHGTVVGVIGGYQQGGATSSVSFSAAFGPWVTALFRTAEARS